MNIEAVHSHLNGYECLLVRQIHVWNELCRVLANAPDFTQFAHKLSENGWTCPAIQPVLLSKGRVSVGLGESVSQHLYAYVRDQIDVGIEILPMKSLQADMSSGPGYYEGELYNVIRNGRGVPSVPLVMVGIAP